MKPNAFMKPTSPLSFPGAIIVFFAWMELTLLLGRFPAIGVYIYMSLHVMRLLIVILLVCGIQRS